MPSRDRVVLLVPVLLVAASCRLLTVKECEKDGDCAGYEQCDTDKGRCFLPPLPDKVVESGFRMELHAFPFPNFSGRDPDSTISADLMQRMYGKAAVCASEVGACRVKPGPKEFQRLINLSLQGGRCEGFAIFADLLFQGELNASDFGAENAAGITVDTPAVKAELAYWFASQYLFDVMVDTTRSLDAEGLVRVLAAEFAKPGHPMYRLGISRIGEDGTRTGGHAVVPIAVVPNGENRFIIKLYDNNHPGQEREMRVDVGAGTWEYQASANPESQTSRYVGTPDNGNLVYLSEAPPRMGQHSCAFCAGSTEQARQIFASAGTSLHATVGTENRTGEVDGRMVKAIPGSAVVPVFSAESHEDRTAIQVVLPPVGRVDLFIRHAGSAGEGHPDDVHIFGPGSVVGVSNMDLEEGEEATLSWDMETDDVTFQPASPSAVTLTVSETSSDGDEVQVTVTLTEDSETESVTVDVEEDNGNPTVKVDSASDENSTVGLTVVRSDEEKEHTLETSVEVPEGGGVEVDVESWEGEGNSAAVHVDHNGDGEHDQTVVVDDTGPVGTPPPAPGNLVATAISNALIRLTWTDNSTNEDDFQIERDSGTGFVLLASVNANTVSHDDANVQINSTYVYRVRAVNPHGQSEYTTPAEATTPGCDPGQQDNDGDKVCQQACAADTCNGHGTCADVTGTVVCTCAIEYSGARCEACATGYQDNDNDGACTTACISTTCGPHGTCSDVTGTATCTCDAGYAGPECGGCAPGYQDNDADQVCTPDCSQEDCSGHGGCSDQTGTATCECAMGYMGPHCESCDVGYQDNDLDGSCNVSCMMENCTNHGVCDDSTGTATCTCLTEYTGADCGSCASGFQDNDGDQICTPACAAMTCNNHGTCNDTSGTATCQCQSEYAGAACEGCAINYQDNDHDGSCMSVCNTTQCRSHGTCSDLSGIATCSCQPEYTGADCESCATGFQDNDQDGTCTPDCGNETCSGHGSCSDTTGTALCQCQTEYSGVHCESCALDFQDNDQDGTCSLACSAAPCSFHAVCDDTTGNITCTCEAAYVGDGMTCDACAPGYQDNDLDTVCTPDCTGETCSGHGVCSDTTGTRTCTCQAPWQGAQCEICPAPMQEMGGKCVGYSCQAIKTVVPTAPSGLYDINSTGTEYRVYCDMETDGGGWILMTKFTQAGGPFGDMDQAFYNGTIADAQWMMTGTTPASSPDPDYTGRSVEAVPWATFLDGPGMHQLRQTFYALDRQDVFDVAYVFTFAQTFRQDGALQSERALELRNRTVLMDTTGIAWDLDDEPARFWLPFSAMSSGPVYSACNGFELSTNGCGMANPDLRRQGNAGIIGATADNRDPAGSWAPSTEPGMDLVRVHQAKAKYGTSGRNMVLMYWLREVPSCASPQAACGFRATCTDALHGAACACSGKFMGLSCAQCDVGYAGLSCVRPTNVSSGGSHGCAIAEGGIKCWGSYSGQAEGIPNQPLASDAPLLNLGSSTPIQVSSGLHHDCAVFQDGTVRCWGDNSIWQARGEAGADVPAGQTDPIPAALNVGGPVQMVAAGEAHTCVLRQDGAVRCWGANSNGECGLGIMADMVDLASSGDVLPGVVAVQVCAGYTHSCALSSTGEVFCWGWGGRGQLGRNSTSSIGVGETAISAGPSQPLSLAEMQAGLQVQALYCGGDNTCAVMNHGQLRCWGANEYGQLGYGHDADIGDDEAPYAAGFVNVGGRVMQATMGYDVTCALLESGKAKCWGWAENGCLGHGTDCGINAPPASTINVGPFRTITELGTRSCSSTLCARLDNGGVKCWNHNAENACGLDVLTSPIDPPSSAYTLPPLPGCGNGVVEATEVCDDGNQLDGDGCNRTCTAIVPPVCGNTWVESGEQCDDGNTVNNDGCSSSCQLEPMCGNTQVEAGEHCDDGNTTNGDGCSSKCQDEQVACGNNRLEVGEQCDDGNTANGDGCSSVCHFEPVCGNSRVEDGEQCDDGNTVNGDGCSSSCQVEPVCGNSRVEVGEQCDDGNTATGDGCSNTCQDEAPVCGNSRVEAGEQCDDGNTANGDGCSSVCQYEVAVCGNDTVEPPEQCDLGVMNDDLSYAGCKTNCQLSPYCGDGTRNGQEECDDGINDGSYNGCNPGCALAPCCGDGILQPQFGEVCDLGIDNSDYTYGGCAKNCLLGPYCGNAVVEGTEECDGEITCRADCTIMFCGDGVVDAVTGEQCDDGNAVSGDGCAATCQLEPAVCGDAVLQAGEVCDDGNANNGDGCGASCTVETASCGNSQVEPGEQCDDGNATGGDGCGATCQSETLVNCGNGWEDDPEQCDDGNPIDIDACSNQCMTNTIAMLCSKTGNPNSSCPSDCTMAGRIFTGQTDCNAAVYTWCPKQCVCACALP